MTNLFSFRAGNTLVLILVAATLTISGCDCRFLFEFEVRFRVMNASGKEIAVTSAHTRQTTRIANGEAGVVPHGDGDITVSQRDGKTWVFKNASPLDLAGTSYRTVSNYPVPFGGGTWTATVVLDKDGRLYAVDPKTGDLDAARIRQRQPKGFPLNGDEAIMGGG